MVNIPGPDKTAAHQVLLRCARIPDLNREWTKHEGHATRFLFATFSRPSRTAALVTATRCASLGDHVILLRFPMRALAMSSTDPSARDDEMGNPLR